MKVKLLVAFIPLLLMFCSCSKEQLDAQNGNCEMEMEYTRSTKFISPLPSQTEDASVGTPHEIVDWDISYDDSINYLCGIYSDDEFTLTYDMNWYDYDISNVAIYSSTYVLPNYIQVDNWNLLNYQNRTVPEVSRCSIEDVPELSDFISEYYPSYNLFDKVTIVNYYSDGNNTSKRFLKVFDDGEDISSEFSGDDTIFFVREQLNGLPLGCELYNYLNLRHFSKMFYLDEYGTISYYPYSSVNSYYNYDLGCFFNISLYNRSDLYPVKENLSVLPITECIKNSVPSILESLSTDGFQNAEVYSAELMYVMFTINCYAPWDIPVDVLYIPVWEVSYYSENNNRFLYGSVFIDALTGESLNPGLIDYDWN